MKRAKFILPLYVAAFLVQGCSEADKSPKPTGLPGDNLDLYAVLDLFKSSSSIESFEKSLNAKSSSVNNLDLNGDSTVDYIRVIDQRSGDDHAITLRVPISKDESQDIAVIEIEKTGDKTASIQVVGDEEIYGKDVVIEPKGESNQAAFVYATTAVGVNVWMWPSVAYVYSPDYVVWVSPYEYDYYPVYWDPWPPVAYEVYYPVVYKNHGQYVAFGQLRFKHAHEIYYSNHTNSPFVMGRMKHGDFHEGRQEHYKGNDFARGNGGFGRADGSRDKFDKGMGGGNDKFDKGMGGGNEKENHGGAGMGNEKGIGGQKDHSGSARMGGGKSSSPSAQKGGGGNKGGGGHQGGGGGHKGGGKGH